MRRLATAAPFRRLSTSGAPPSWSRAPPPSTRATAGSLGRPAASQAAQAQPPRTLVPSPPRSAAPAPPSQPPRPQPSAAASGPTIFDVKAAEFQAKVLQASMTTPILLDLWAPWCGPCKQLTPILEQAVNAAGGRVKLAKLNTDENQELAQMLKVQSLPTVLAVFQGKVVDQFIGLQSAQKVQEVVMRLLALAASAPPASGLSDPNSLDAIGKDVDLALQLLDDQPTEEEMPEIIQVLKRGAGVVLPKTAAGAAPQRADQERAEDVRALSYAGLVLAALHQKDFEAAKQVAEQLRGKVPKLKLELAPVKRALAAAALAMPAGDDSELGKLEAALKSNPGNSEARLALAKVLFAQGNASRAVDEALELLKRDRAHANGAARTLLLDIFAALGATSPIVKDGRKRMSSVLLN